MRNIHPNKYRRAFNQVLNEGSPEKMRQLADTMEADDKLSDSDKNHAKGAANELRVKADAFESGVSGRSGRTPGRKPKPVNSADPKPEAAAPAPATSARTTPKRATSRRAR